MNYQKTIIYTIACLALFWIIIRWGSSLVVNKICLKEGLTDFEKYSHKVIPYPKDAVINLNDKNSPLYSHTVNLPFNSPYSCQNFCGPQAQCAITRDQCSTDIDCPGCQPPENPRGPCKTKDVPPYDPSDLNQGLQYSDVLTTDNGRYKDYAEASPGSLSSTLQQPYLGLDLWTPSFNKGLQLYNKSRETHDKYSQGVFQGGAQQGIPFTKADFTPQYPTTVSATGQFYETTPPAANTTLSP